jgi:hypothetical protein
VLFFSLFLWCLGITKFHATLVQEGIPTEKEALRAAPDALPAITEAVVGGGAEQRDSGDTHDENQSQHHAILDRRGTVFILQEIDQLLTELTHDAPFVLP